MEKKIPSQLVGRQASSYLGVGAGVWWVGDWQVLQTKPHIQASQLRIYDLGKAPERAESASFLARNREGIGSQTASWVAPKDSLANRSAYPVLFQLGCLQKQTLRKEAGYWLT